MRRSALQLCIMYHLYYKQQIKEDLPSSSYLDIVLEHIKPYLQPASLNRICKEYRQLEHLFKKDGKGNWKLIGSN